MSIDSGSHPQAVGDILLSVTGAQWLALRIPRGDSRLNWRPANLLYQRSDVCLYLGKVCLYLVLGKPVKFSWVSCQHPWVSRANHWLTSTTVSRPFDPRIPWSSHLFAGDHHHHDDSWPFKQVKPHLPPLLLVLTLLLGNLSIKTRCNRTPLQMEETISLALIFSPSDQLISLSNKLSGQSDICPASQAWPGDTRRWWRLDQPW